jgi:hypothetical protein
MAQGLWDRESANVGAYDTEDGVLAFIHRIVQAHGPDVVFPWALVHEDEAEETRSIANGPDLSHRAHEAVRA